MAKKTNRRFPRFALAVILYAVVFLLLVGIGLTWFWGFMEAFELSQPEHAIENYMAQLSNDALYAGSAQQISQLDSNLITQEQCYAMIDQAVAGGITYAKNNKESNSERYVYMLLSGENTIGKVVTQPGEPGKYGLRNWAATEDSFDFSFLAGSSISVTVPHDFTVSLNNTVLDERYISQTDIPYTVLKDYYNELSDLPYMVTYDIPALWGNYEPAITNQDGNPVSIGASTVMEDFLLYQDAEKLEQQDTLVCEYLDSYMKFISSGRQTRKWLYTKLSELVSDSSPLESRLYNAISELQWVIEQNAKLLDTSRNTCLALGSGRYLYDVTYTTQSTKSVGPVEESTNAKFILVETDGQFFIESMQIY